MEKYKVSFKEDDTNKIITYTVMATGIIPAIEKAIEKDYFGGKPHVHFRCPIKCELVEH